MASSSASEAMSSTSSSSSSSSPLLEFRFEPAIDRRDPNSVITALGLDDDGGRIYVGAFRFWKRVKKCKSRIDCIEQRISKTKFFSLSRLFLKKHTDTTTIRNIRWGSGGVEPST